MSVYGLFMQADWVVKAVMIALLLASFWSWAIIFEKMLRLRSLKKSAQAFEDTLLVGRLAGRSLRPRRRQAGRSDVDLLGRHARMAPVGVEGPGDQRHGARCASPAHRAGHGVTIQREMEAIEKRLGFLATVGANATFVGLFGTVWGIMNSFGPSRSPRTPRSRSWRPASPRRCSPPRSAWSPRSRRPAPTTSCRPGRALRQQLESFAGEFITILVAPARGAGLMAGSFRRRGRSAPTASSGGGATGRSPRSTSRRWSTSCWCC